MVEVPLGLAARNRHEPAREQIEREVLVAEHVLRHAAPQLDAEQLSVSFEPQSVEISRARKIPETRAIRWGGVDCTLGPEDGSVFRQVRRDCADYLFTGQRADVVRRTDGQLRYAQRLIVLDNTVLSASKISVFF